MTTTIGAAMEMEEEGAPAGAGRQWFAPNKVQHVLACLLVPLAYTELAGRRSRPIPRRRALAMGVEEVEGGHTHAAEDSSGFASA
ncbi:hypothetical protein BRADI_3g04220v3 [Brachypodium distachyon]|uniref:Uncharacterized protein n=1 Tax=Brachypodium distachyon TaxID=15368 RepID=A0A2K2CV56_BRADI|nr:hypothetical protein BRADI_3g04220v3 [Brachypodium distachyon]